MFYILSIYFLLVIKCDSYLLNDDSGIFFSLYLNFCPLFNRKSILLCKKCIGRRKQSPFPPKSNFLHVIYQICIHHIAKMKNIKLKNCYFYCLEVKESHHVYSTYPLFCHRHQHSWEGGIKPLNPNQTEGGPNGPPCRKIMISPEPNLRWTSDQSVNSSLSVVVQ